MRIKKRLLFGVVFFSSLFCGCEKASFLSDSEQGELLVKLSADVSVTGQTEVIAKASEPGTNIDEYAILITKEGKPYAGFDTYAELPQNKRIKLYNGDYTFKAYWGENVISGFDKPYFEGVQNFTINRTETTPIDVVCKAANVKISIIYTESFKEAFKNYVAYRAEINTDLMTAPLVYRSNEIRSGYFRPSPFVVTVVLTKSTGESFSYSFPKISENVAAGNHYNLSLRGKDVGDPEAAMTIEVNDVTNNVSETYEVDRSDIAKNKPQIQYSFNNTVPYEMVVYQPKSGEVLLTYVKSEAGLKDVVIKSTDPLFVDNGIPSEVSFGSLKTNVALAAKMKAIGFNWEETVEGQTGYKLVFTGILKNLEMSADDERVDHPFTLEATDLFGQTSVSDFTVTTKRPVFEPSVTQGQMWARYAYVKPLSSAQITDGDYEFMKRDFIYEYSRNNIDWTVYTPSEDGFFEISGLHPDTEYFWRVRYKQFVSPVRVFRTESETALPNGDMESWGGDNDVMLSHEGVNYCRWTVPGWGTNNPMTTMGSGTTDYNYCRFSGTQRVTDKTQGNYAAKLVTVGWGKGNSMAGGASICYNTSPGKLVTGTIDNSGNLTQRGIEFASRPYRMAYDFKHIPFHGRKYRAFVVVENREGDRVTEIGRSEIHLNGETVDTYKTQELDIVYNPVYLDLPATHIYIEFATAENDNTNIDDRQCIYRDAGMFSGYKDSSHEGSNLYLDNIRLIYSKK